MTERVAGLLRVLLTLVIGLGGVGIVLAGPAMPGSTATGKALDRDLTTLIPFQ